MPAPSTIADFIDLIRRSGVVDDDRLKAYFEQAKAGNPPTDPSKFADAMIRDGILTRFQAGQFLLGKWKRFNIGKYRVLEKLGSGGMAQVFLCEHKMMRRRVAIKVLPTSKAEDPASLERFYREARAVAALDHPNLVRAFDIDEDQNLNYLVMEYVDGASFHDLIRRHGPLDPLRACHYFHQAATGLDYAHQVAGLVHRDIKPGNVLIDRTGTVKILDMGLARFFNDEADVLTHKYDESVLGTADYLAPEQAVDSHSVDIRADIYSLGATLYFVLTGGPPFPDGTIAQKLMWHQTKPPRPLGEVRHGLPNALIAVVERMMKKDRGERYQSPAELAEALRPLIETPIPPPPDAEMPQLSLAAMAGTGSPAQAAARVSARPGTRSSGAVSLGNIVLGSKPGSSSVLASVARKSGPESPSRGNSETIRDRDTPRPSNPFGNLISGPTGSKAEIDAIKSLYAPSALPLQSVEPTTGYRTAFWIAVGVIAVLTAGGSGYYFADRGRPKATVETPKEPPPAPGVRKLFVNPNGAGDSLRSVADAIRKARSGDRIILQSPTIQETLSLDGRQDDHGDIVIESGLPDGKPVVWTAPVGTSANKQLLELVDIEGVTLRNVVFDGRGELEAPVRIAGQCPGTTFENVRIRGYLKAGIRLTDAQGEEDRPIAIAGTRFQSAGSAECGLRMVSTHPSRPLQHINIVDCQFDSAGTALVYGSGAATQVKFERNRFGKADDGLRWRPLSKDHSLQIRLVGNTFSDIKTAVHLEGAPAAESNSFVQIEQSLFVKCGSALMVDGAAAVPFAGAINNVRDERTQDGQLPQPSRQVQVTFLSKNPNDESKYLRYPPTSSLLKAGSNGGPVGVPPVE